MYLIKNLFMLIIQIKNKLLFFSIFIFHLPQEKIFNRYVKNGLMIFFMKKNI